MQTFAFNSVMLEKSCEEVGRLDLASLAEPQQTGMQMLRFNSVTLEMSNYVQKPRWATRLGITGRHAKYRHADGDLYF